MDIASLTGQAAAAASQAQIQQQSAATAAANSTASAISSDFETFLLMMTTQARYQDPLEPIDNSEYTAQLAQFSMVEQQVKTNDLLEALNGALSTPQAGEMTMSDLSGWIGMDALTFAPARFDGTPVTVSPNPLASADEVQMVVYNEAGQEVQRQAIPLSPTPVQWYGTAELNGTSFPDGNYTFEIESYQRGELMLAERASTYGRIQEARIEDGKPILVLAGGVVVMAADVNGLREGA